MRKSLPLFRMCATKNDIICYSCNTHREHCAQRKFGWIEINFCFYFIFFCILLLLWNAAPFVCSYFSRLFEQFVSGVGGTWNSFILFFHMKHVECTYLRTAQKCIMNYHYYDGAPISTRKKIYNFHIGNGSNWNTKINKEIGKTKSPAKLFVFMYWTNKCTWCCADVIIITTQ